MTMHTHGWVEVPDPMWYVPGSREWAEQGAHWEAILDLTPFLSWHMVKFFTPESWKGLDSVLREGFPPDASILSGRRLSRPRLAQRLCQ